MSAYRGHVFGSHEDSRCRRARAHHRDVRGEAGEQARAAEIAALPSKLWKGRPVFQMLCNGDFGKGPHDVWLPERVLWALASLTSYRCPYHAC